MAGLFFLEPGNWQLDTGNEFFTVSLIRVDPAIPLDPLLTEPQGPVLPPVIMAPMLSPQGWRA